MAGTNHIPKYQQFISRENEVTLKRRGPGYGQVDEFTVPPTGGFTAAQMFQYTLKFNNNHVSPFTGPSLDDILVEMGKHYLVTAGSAFETIFYNSSPTSKDIVFPTSQPSGPITITLPAATHYELRLEVVPSPANSPQLALIDASSVTANSIMSLLGLFGRSTAANAGNNQNIVYSPVTSMLIWDTASGMYVDSYTFATNNPTQAVFIPSLNVPYMSILGRQTASWTTQGRILEVVQADWGTTGPVMAGQVSKTQVIIFNNDPNSTAVGAAPNNWQGAADPKNVMLKIQSSANTLTSTPSLPLSGHRVKAWSITNGTPGASTGDYTGEISYMRMDGTIATINQVTVSSRVNKTNIEEMKDTVDSVSVVRELKPSLFHLKHSTDVPKSAGFIAEEVHELSDKFPVLKSFVEINEEGNPMGIKINHFVPLLFDAVKALIKRVEELENKI